MAKAAQAKRVNHMAITVSDMDCSLQFYCGLLGLKQQNSTDVEGPTISKLSGKERVRMKIVSLVCPHSSEVAIELQQYFEPVSKKSDSNLGDIGNAHLCIEVEDIHKAYDELKAVEVEFVSEPVEFDLDDGRKVICVFLMDPDGYMLELVAFLN